MMEHFHHYLRTVKITRFIVKALCQIRTVSLDVTDKCNASCKKCLLRYIQPKFPDMTLQQFETLLSQLPKTVKSITWAGMGEPLLNKDVPSMIIKAKTCGYETVLYTNGTIPLNGLERFIDIIIFNSETTYPENLRAGRKNTFIAYVEGDDPVKAKLLSKNFPLQKTAFRRMYPGIEFDGLPLDVKEGEAWKTCLSPWTHVNISHDLYVTPCCIHQHPPFFCMGKIGRDGTLKQIWKSPKYFLLRKSLSNGNPNKLCLHCGV